MWVVSVKWQVVQHDKEEPIFKIYWGQTNLCVRKCSLQNYKNFLYFYFYFSIISMCQHYFVIGITM